MSRTQFFSMIYLMENHFKFTNPHTLFLQDVLELGHQYWTPCKVNHFNFISNIASLIVTKLLHIFLLKNLKYDFIQKIFIEKKI